MSSPTVYLCYSHHHPERGRTVFETLEQQGVDVLDATTASRQTGENLEDIDQLIQTAIFHAQYFLLVLFENVVKEIETIEDYLNLALTHQKQVQVLLHKDIQDIPKDELSKLPENIRRLLRIQKNDTYQTPDDLIEVVKKIADGFKPIHTEEKAVDQEPSNAALSQSANAANTLSSVEKPDPIAGLLIETNEILKGNNKWVIIGLIVTLIVTYISSPTFQNFLSNLISGSLGTTTGVTSASETVGSPLATHIPTFVPTQTPITPSVTPLATQSPVPPSATATATWTPSATLTATQTPVPPSATPTATPTLTECQRADLSGDGQLTQLLDGNYLFQYINQSYPVPYEPRYDFHPDATPVIDRQDLDALDKIIIRCGGS